MLTRTGDKANHVAAIHIPQLLYFFPFTVFFSWPVLLPLLCDPTVIASRLPRPATVFALLGIAGIAVYSNTIIHPFLLADNRHYTFYVIRLLHLKYSFVRYLAVPIYFLCGWFCIAALGGRARPRRGSVVATSKGRVEPDTIHMSFILVWLVSTSLSLVTAPLVEPRYFILPWLMWRLHVPEVFPSQLRNETGGIMSRLAQYSPQLEFLWYMTINLATCGIFLFRSFEWVQEPGKQQRFMW
jgi:alpha-1,2-glucosyltransferase